MRIHMMAVGGTGMGALAGLLKAQGHDVTGCDNALYPPMSEAIARYGIPTRTGFDPSHIEPPPDVLIVGNAVHADNPEAVAAIEEGVEYLSMAEAIRRFAIAGRKSLVVAGTHGKTTTSALCGYLMNEAGFHPNLIVGGIAKDFDASFLWGGGEWTVVEGDEYETAFFDKGPKFLHYEPEVLVVSNIEMDHLDNFKDLAALENAFVRLLGVVREGGIVIAGTESPSVKKVLTFSGRKVRSFGLTGAEDWYASDVTFASECTRFRLNFRGRNLGVFESRLYGAHNLRNTLAAFAACQEVGVDVEALREALPRFSGVRRRQEVVYDSGSFTVLDDFAHHPTAIHETLKAVKQRYPGRRLITCFEPRSFTCQTKLHEVAFRQAFTLSNVILLAAVSYSAKIPPKERLDLENLKANLEGMDKHAEVLPSPEAFMDWFSKNLAPGDLVAFFSSGNFDDLPARLAELLSTRPATG